MDEEARHRVHLLAGEDQWRPRLEAVLSPDILPKHMKGKTTLNLHGLCPTSVPSLQASVVLPSVPPGPRRAQPSRKADKAEVELSGLSDKRGGQSAAAAAAAAAAAQPAAAAVKPAAAAAATPAVARPAAAPPPAAGRAAAGRPAAAPAQQPASGAPASAPACATGEYEYEYDYEYEYEYEDEQAMITRMAVEHSSRERNFGRQPAEPASPARQDAQGSPSRLGRLSARLGRMSPRSPRGLAASDVAEASGEDLAAALWSPEGPGPQGSPPSPGSPRSPNSARLPALMAESGREDPFAWAEVSRGSPGGQSERKVGEL